MRRLLRLGTTPLEYWIARRSLSSGGRSADPVAGDDRDVAGTRVTPPPVIARGAHVPPASFFTKR
jgi:hypothetical protein